MSRNGAKRRRRAGFGLFGQIAPTLPDELGLPIFRYGMAVVAVATCVALSLALVPVSYTTPFLFLYPGVLVAAWFGGLGPGLLATVLASVAANYFLLPPYKHFSLAPEPLVKTLFFCLTFASVSYLTELARVRAKSRSEHLQDALRESDTELDAERTRWKEVVQGIADEVWISDDQGRMSLVNLPAVTRMGLEEFKNKSIQQVMETVEILDTDGKPRRPEAAPLLRALHGETVRGEEIMRDRATGVCRWRQFSAAPLRDTAGTIIGSVAVVRDITEQVEAEEQLHVQAAALRSAANAIVITDRNGIILWVNPAFSQLTGYRAEEVLGDTPRVLKSAHHDQQFYNDMWRTIRAGEVWQGEVINRRKDGSMYVEEMTITPVQNQHGEISHFIAIKVDVTDRRRAERALIRNEKLAATGRLAATIVHEIKNPLETMTNLLYLIGPSVSASDPAAGVYLELMKKQLQAVNRIASQTLDFHRENTEAASFNLSQLSSELLDFYQPKAKQQGVKLLKRIEPEMNMIGFVGEIRQVISNLLLNAIDATPAGGKVVLHLYEGPDWQDLAKRGCRISIADNGTGIEAEHRKRIFEPFFSTKGERGTGLGLWVSVGAIQRAGGFLRVWSTRRTGRSGTCFSIFLPPHAPDARIEIAVSTKTWLPPKPPATHVPSTAFGIERGESSRFFEF